MGTRKPNWGAIGLSIFVAIVLIVSIIVFLVTKEGYGQYEPISGWQALKLQGAGFWITAIVCLGLGTVAVKAAIANETGAGAWGRKLQGKTWVTFALIILAAGLIFGPWGKACTDKGNAGVTAPNYGK